MEFELERKLQIMLARGIARVLPLGRPQAAEISPSIDKFEQGPLSRAAPHWRAYRGFGALNFRTFPLPPTGAPDGATRRRPGVTATPLHCCKLIPVMYCYA